MLLVRLVRRQDWGTTHSSIQMLTFAAVLCPRRSVLWLEGAELVGVEVCGCSGAQGLESSAPSFCTTVLEV
jgi:hypothetical protein